MKPRLNNCINILQHKLTNMLIGMILCIFSILTFSGCTASKSAKGFFQEDFFGKVKSIKRISFDGADTTFMTVESFSAAGKPERIDFYYTDYISADHVLEFIYDKKGNINTTIKIDEKGDTSIVQHHSPDSGNMKKLTKRDKDINPHFPKKAVGWITGTYIDLNHQTTTWLVYLNKRRHQIESHTIDTTGHILDKTFIKNDDKGNRLKLATFKNDTLLFTVEQTFDKYSNMLSTQKVYPNQKPGNAPTFTYEYDNHKNWIKKFILVNGNETLLEVQLIEYY